METERWAWWDGRIITVSGVCSEVWFQPKKPSSEKRPLRPRSGVIFRDVSLVFGDVLKGRGVASFRPAGNRKAGLTRIYGKYL